MPLTALATEPPGTDSNDPAATDLAAARLTLVGEATIVSLSVLGSAITAIADGTLAIHLLPRGGADLASPGSFARGRPIATFTGRFQNDLALDSPDNAGVALGADLIQRSARAFTLAGRRQRLGRAGLAWTLRASGRGVRTDPTEPRSELFVSGDLGVIDAEPVR